MLLYYSFARYLPCSYKPWGGKMSKRIRYFCCKHIFKECGTNVNVERMAFFRTGKDVIIGENSSIGIRCSVPDDIIIGSNVMMGPDCYILSRNHKFSRTDIPMISQGYSNGMQTIIEDDVWIGMRVLMTPGRHVKKGTIIAAGTVLCKDFDTYSIVGGNPSRLIKKRL